MTIKHFTLKDGVELSNVKISHKFAWLPTYIRDDFKWVWLKKYTRVYAWSSKLDRFRTINTALGWLDNISVSKEFHND